MPVDPALIANSIPVPRSRSVNADEWTDNLYEDYTYQRDCIVNRENLLLLIGQCMCCTSQPLITSKSFRSTVSRGRVKSCDVAVVQIHHVVDRWIGRELT